MTPPHVAVSVLMRAASSAGVLVKRSRPWRTMAVCTSACWSAFGREVAAGAAAVVHDPVLAHRGAQLRSDDARQRVGAAARGEPEDEADRAGRICGFGGLRDAGSGAEGKHGECVRHTAQAGAVLHVWSPRSANDRYQRVAALSRKRRATSSLQTPPWLCCAHRGMRGCRSKSQPAAVLRGSLPCCNHW